MKKVITCFVALVCLISLPSFLKAQSGSSTSPLFANDITIEANNLANQRGVKISSAYNGWLFAAYIVNDSVSHKGGVVVRYSKNGGINWDPFNGYAYNAHSFYTACDIAVAGLDSNHLNVFLGTARKNLTTNKYEVNVERYNPLHINFPATSVFFQLLDTNIVSDLALASDYRYPAVKDTIYGVGLLYSHAGVSRDSLIFGTTRKYNGKFGKKLHLVSTGPHYRKVALSYLHSAAAQQGVYIAAWEQLALSSSVLGHIYSSRTSAGIDSVWQTPKCLDSLSVSTNGFVRSPSIAGQVNNANNDSSHVTAAVVFDCARNGNPDSLDIIGFYNKKADSSDFWNRFSVASTTNNELQPCISFDGTAGNFVLTYYDSTSGSLPYLSQPLNFPSANSWTVIKSAYNNNSTLLKAPWPKIVMNPLSNKAFFAWVNVPANKNGVVVCDGENIFTGLPVTEGGNGFQAYPLYPNPTSSFSILPVYTESAAEVRLAIFNTLGDNVISEQKIVLSPGMQSLEIHTDNLASGFYFCRLTSGAFNQTFRLSVQHQ